MINFHEILPLNPFLHSCGLLVNSAKTFYLLLRQVLSFDDSSCAQTYVRKTLILGSFSMFHDSVFLYVTEGHICKRV